MKRIALFSLLAGLGVLGTTSSAMANGFVLHEVSPAGVAQGGAMMAAGDEPATVFFNPAGMTRLKSFEAQASALAYIAPPTSFENSTLRTSERSDPQVFPLGSLFVTGRPTDWLAVGIGGYSIYGLGSKWAEKWSGYAITKQSQLQSFQVQPSIAFGPFKGVSVGAGFDYLIGAFDLSRGLNFGDDRWGTVRMGGATTAMGWNAGVLYEPMKELRLALTYRGAMKVALDKGGKAEFNVPAAFQESFRNQGVKTSLNLPHIFGVGARVKATNELELEADFLYSTFSSYKDLTFTFDDRLLTATQSKNWHDSWQLRIGGKYDIDKVTLRAGFIYDATPVPDATLDPIVPDADRLDFSGGVGYSFGKVRADMAYMLVKTLPRTVSASQNAFPGTYESTVHVVSLGAGVAF